MDNQIIAYTYLEANHDATLSIYTGFDQICAQLNGAGLTLSGRGASVAEALSNLDEDIRQLGISREAFSRRMPQPVEIGAQAFCHDCGTAVSRMCFYPGYGYCCWDCLKRHVGEELS